MSIEELAALVMEKCRENGAGGIEQAQVYALGEETGEFIGAMRRWRGMARRTGTEEEAQMELADIVISAYGMAYIMGWDIEELVRRKGEKMMTRGWKEQA